MPDAPFRFPVPTPAGLYLYKAKDARVIDGDTIECTIDLGFAVAMRRVVRFHNYDAPEVRGPKASPEGATAAAWLRSTFERWSGPAFYLLTHRDTTGAYNRIVGSPFVFMGGSVEKGVILDVVATMRRVDWAKGWDVPDSVIHYDTNILEVVRHEPGR